MSSIPPNSKWGGIIPPLWITGSLYPHYIHYISIISPSPYGSLSDPWLCRRWPKLWSPSFASCRCKRSPGVSPRGWLEGIHVFPMGTSWNQFIAIYIVSQPYSGFTWALDHGNNDWTKLYTHIYIYINMYIKSGLNSERWLCKACRIGSKPATKHRKTRFYHSVNIEALNPPQRFLWPTRSTIWNTSVRIYE